MSFNNKYVNGALGSGTGYQGMYNPNAAPEVYAPSQFSWGQSTPVDAGSNFRMGEIAANPAVNTAYNSFGGAGNWTTPVIDAFTPGSDFMKGMLGGKNADGTMTNGWGGGALDAAKSLFGGFMAMKQYGLSKDIFDNNKQQFERNFGAQKGITNSQLSDRQDRRNADARLNGQTGTQSTADYMSKWGVK